MIESFIDIVASDYPGTDTMLVDADLADWIEQRQAVPLADEDYPHLDISRAWSAELSAH